MSNPFRQGYQFAFQASQADDHQRFDEASFYYSKAIDCLMVYLKGLCVFCFVCLLLLLFVVIFDHSFY